MNQKEINELRRRFRPEKSAISRVYGCYVNSSKEIVSDLDESLGMMPQEESEKYLSLLKKGLSGSLGKNLIDIVFSTQQVVDSEEHRLLTTLRDSQLKDNEARQTFYRKVIDSLDMGDSSYLLLLTCDSYDVPHRGKDDSLQADASDEVFTYIVCVVCPIKEGKVELGYFPGDNEFHCAAGQTVAPPELGFLFPAFDDRAANIDCGQHQFRRCGGDLLICGVIHHFSADIRIQGICIPDHPAHKTRLHLQNVGFCLIHQKTQALHISGFHCKL